jgi:hypothetical protein
MKGALARPSPPGLWSTVFLLLGATRKRAAGRQKRQQELLRHRTGKKSAINWGNLGFILAAVFMALLNLGAAFVVYTAGTSGERIQAEIGGKIVVDRWFLKSVDEHTSQNSYGLVSNPGADQNLNYDYYREANDISREYGSTEKAVEQRLGMLCTHTAPGTSSQRARRFLDSVRCPGQALSRRCLVPSSLFGGQSC